jgi:hypothetical protein
MWLLIVATILLPLLFLPPAIFYFYLALEFVLLAGALIRQPRLRLTTDRVKYDYVWIPRSWLYDDLLGAEPYNGPFAFTGANVIVRKRSGTTYVWRSLLFGPFQIRFDWWLTSLPPDQVQTFISDLNAHIAGVSPASSAQ